MIIFPTFSKKNNEYYLLIVKKELDNYEILFKKKFIVTENILKEFLSGLENFLEDLDMRVDICEQGLNTNKEEIVLNFLPNNDSIIIKCVVEENSALIILKDNNDNKIFNVDFNSLYSSIEEIYLYFYFNDSSYLDKLKLPKEVKWDY